MARKNQRPSQKAQLEFNVGRPSYTRPLWMTDDVISFAIPALAFRSARQFPHHDEDFFHSPVCPRFNNQPAKDWDFWVWNWDYDDDLGIGHVEMDAFNL